MEQNAGSSRSEQERVETDSLWRASLVSGLERTYNEEIYKWGLHDDTRNRNWTIYMVHDRNEGGQER